MNGVDPYVVVSAAGLNSAALIQAELANQAKNNYYLKTAISVGGVYYLIFATASLK